jgi:5'-deoxynucleotidase YfbR-like HD superfamily hydrolase
MSHIAKTWLAHRTQRYHTNARLAHIGQTNADHAHGVASICADLFPDACTALLRACLLHDAGEWKAGDLPQPFKAANPVIARHHEEVEQEFAQQITGWLIGLSEEDYARLKLCDALEAILFAAFHQPAVLDRADWMGFVKSTIAHAEAHDVGDKVKRAIEATKRGWFA